MNIYVVDYWLPFPSSEYGGLEVYCFENREQLEEELLSTVSDYEKRRYPDYKKVINTTVKRAKEFILDPSKVYPKGLVDSMTT